MRNFISFLLGCRARSGAGVVSNFTSSPQNKNEWGCELKNPQEVLKSVSYWDAGVVKNPQEVLNADARIRTWESRRTKIFALSISTEAIEIAFPQRKGS